MWPPLFKGRHCPDATRGSADGSNTIFMASHMDPMNYLNVTSGPCGACRLLAMQSGFEYLPDPILTHRNDNETPDESNKLQEGAEMIQSNCPLSSIIIELAANQPPNES